MAVQSEDEPQLGETQVLSEKWGWVESQGFALIPHVSGDPVLFSFLTRSLIEMLKT